VIKVLAVLFILFLAEAARGIVLPTISTYVEKVRGCPQPHTNLIVRYGFVLTKHAPPCA
jgi:hypothetical protein